VIVSYISEEQLSERWNPSSISGCSSPQASDMVWTHIGHLQQS
jgi:hypothetical protein